MAYYPNLSEVAKGYTPSSMFLPSEGSTRPSARGDVEKYMKEAIERAVEMKARDPYQDLDDRYHRSMFHELLEGTDLKNQRAQEDRKKRFDAKVAELDAILDEAHQAVMDRAYSATEHLASLIVAVPDKYREIGIAEHEIASRRQNALDDKTEFALHMAQIRSRLR
jgi:hypothetical protein